MKHEEASSTMDRSPTADLDSSVAFLDVLDSETCRLSTGSAISDLVEPEKLNMFEPQRSVGASSSGSSGSEQQEQDALPCTAAEEEQHRQWVQQQEHKRLADRERLRAAKVETQKRKAKSKVQWPEWTPSRSSSATTLVEGVPSSPPATTPTHATDSSPVCAQRRRNSLEHGLSRVNIAHLTALVDTAKGSTSSLLGTLGKENGSSASLGQSPVVHSGWLYKKGGGTKTFSRRNWKHRYFMLTAQTLSYFDAPNGEMLGRIHLRDVLEIEHVEVLGETGFTVVTPSRTYCFTAKTKELGEAWREQIRIVRGDRPLHVAGDTLAKSKSFHHIEVDCSLLY